MSHEDAEDFCRRLYAALGRPRDNQDEDRAFMAVVAQRLETFTRSELTEAGDRIMDTYTGKSRWPRLAELKNYCNQARTTLQARLQAERNPKTVASSAEGVPYVPTPEALQFVRDAAAGKIWLGDDPKRAAFLKAIAKRMVTKRRMAELVEGKKQ